MQYNPVHPHCGPFNSVDEQKPSDPVDAICWAHDKAYGEYLEQGISPYSTWTAADDKFVYNMRGLNSSWGDFYANALQFKRFTPFSKLGNDMVPNDPLPVNAQRKRVLAEVQHPILTPNSEAKRLKSLSKNSRSVKSVRRLSKKMPRRYRKSSRYSMRMRKRRRTRRGRSAQSVRKLAREALSYGPIQVKTKFTTGSIATDSFNKVKYSNLVFLNQSTLNNLMDVYKPYFIRDSLTAGAYDGGLEFAQRDMSSTALDTRNPKIKITGGYNKRTFRNNSLYSCEIKLYLYRCHCATDDTPFALYARKIDDKYHGTKDETLLHMDYPSQYQDAIKESWNRIGRVQTIKLDPGKEFTYSHKVGPFIYQDDVATDNGKAYQPGSYCLLARLVGGIVHDTTTTTLVGTADVQVDYITRSQVNYRHIDNHPISSKFEDHDFDTITNQDQVNMDIEEN